MRTDIGYRGGCDDIMVEVTNAGFVGFNVLAAAVLVSVEGMTYGTSSDVAGVTALAGTGLMTPPMGWERNDPNFDFSSWTPLKPVTEIVEANFAQNFVALDAAGAQPVSTTGSLETREGVWGFRIVVPYC